MKYKTILIALLPFLIFSETILELDPVITTPLQFTKDFLKNFNSPEMYEKADTIWKEMRKRGVKYSNLSEADKKVLSYIDETKETPWETVGSACSWYCSGGPSKVVASSQLDSSKGKSYFGENAHDFTYKNAWVEGVPGYGIGETLTYYFKYGSPRITKIIIANGYVKSTSTWKNNSRVKKLKVYLNDKPYALLNLTDTSALQEFKLKNPLGFKEPKSNDEWTLKFEILDVYKGQKYDDVAISEIYFDGVDVH